MKLHYIKADPTGNITVLILDPVPRELHGAAASRIMQTTDAEQVGYLEAAGQPAAARLQMMGGEFCGNATISLAAVLAQRDGLKNADYLLEVSGSSGLVSCRIETRSEAVFGTVAMPLPEEIDRSGKYPAICFPGIIHQIAPAADFPDTAAAEAYAKRSCFEQSAEAFGLLLWDSAEQFMRPCVYVAATDSATWECGCASGSAALGAYLTLSDGQASHGIRQPGGTITVRCVADDESVTALSVTGSVRIADEGIIDISL